jgi:amino acid adenylation domain-containing protein/thioester reductase-like protein
VTGEIYIGGAGVARGYLNRPDLTAERFIANPFSKAPEACLYRSGDLGRWRADGTIEYRGRNDQQVKIRGYRIELGEIEARLALHYAVKDAVVLAREDVPGEKRLVAYVTRRDPFGVEMAQSVQALRTYLKAVLPQYMLPAAFVMLERLPTTPNGKVDRRALPAPEFGSYGNHQYEAPQGEVEEILAGIWQRLLRVERIGRQDNFFELGGHSLLIVQMMEQLRRVGLSTEVRLIFESPTLADLAKTLIRGADGQLDVPPNLIPPDCEAITPQMLPLLELEAEHIERIAQEVPGGVPNIKDIYPLAPLQEGILFHHLLDEQSGDVYVVSIVLSVSSRERLEEFIAALQGVIDRHDVLRTAVLWEQLPRPVQVVYRQATLPVVVIALDPDRDSTEQMREWIKPERQRLNLRQAPLMRLQVAADAHAEHWYALLQSHHIIGDHESVESMFAEVAAYLGERTQELPEPMPYRNHVAQALAYARMHDSEAFFSRKLGDIDEPTAPFDLLDVHGDGSRIEEARRVFESELATTIRVQARRLAVSAATLFHAAWALVVARTSGRDDVVFGSVLLGRLQGSAGAQRTLGLFINTLPLRLRLKDMTAKILVEQTQRELVELLSYEQATLAEAQRCSLVTRSSPLFSSLLNYRHSVLDLGSELARTAGLTLLMTRGWTNYPITLSVDDLGEGFVLTSQTDRRIDAQRMMGYMHTATQALAEALEKAPETSAMELSILPESERHQVIELFNKTRATYPPEKLIHELFEEQVRRTPDAIAVVYEGQRLTYAELNGKANQLARYLRGRGVGPDQLVGICVDRSLEMVVGLLAILKAAGAYVPLDPNYPTERLQYMLRDAAPKVVLTQEHLRARLPQSAGEVIELDNDWSGIAQGPLGNLDARYLGLHSHHLAYVIYTSGSTGQPKGVMVEHGNVTRLLAATEEWFHFSERDVWTLFHSYAFDFSVWELWGALLYGGRVVVVPYLTARSPQEFYHLLCDEGVTVLNQTPSAFAQLIDAQAQNAEMTHSLRAVIFGGEALELRTLQPWVARNGAEAPQLVNMYGITETTVHVTYCPLTEKEIESERGSLIGRPIPDLQAYLLNQQGQPVPVGVPGEMYVAGAGVARGYLNRPDLTAQRFLPNPFSTEPQARMYKTGDMGRWRPDGTIEYLGRNDHQVKMRGFRIELGEIEAQLARHAHVKDAVVIPREDEPGEKRLVGYVVPDMSQLKALGDDELEKGGAELVDQWQALYEETYSLAELAPSFVGWNSSYTGQPIPENQMREWLHSTLDRIRALKPRKVLEIGCGVGLLLEHLASGCDVYRGTDISGEAIERLRRWVSTRAELRHVQLQQCSALELEGPPPSSYDTVILNSVVQYFPDIEYLRAVLKCAVNWLPAGGRIFVGDVRHLGLIRTFHSSVQLEKAAAGTAVAQLRGRIVRAIEQEKELVIEPRFFERLREHLPGVSGVQILIKRGRADNELTRYRYDVVLEVGNPRVMVEREWIDWKSSKESVADLSAHLKDKHPPSLRIRGVANRRLCRDLAAERLIDRSQSSQQVEALQEALNQQESEGQDPELFWELGDAHGYETRVSWNVGCKDGTFDVDLTDRLCAVVEMPVPELDAYQAERSAATREREGSYANDPWGYHLKQQLVPRLRDYLRAKLPPYMVPDAFVMLESFPLTPNGKLDRRALPAPELGLYSNRQYDAPQGGVEEALAEIWQGLLRIERVGTQDNFFEIGGHSLLAIRMLSKVNQSFASNLSVLDAYNSPTIRELGTRICGGRAADEFVDLSREAVLAEGIAAKPALYRLPEKTILLTGCTGFVGRFLLAQLLQDMDATVYCMVRAGSTQQAFYRIRTALLKWGLWRDEFEHRIVAIPGDLSLARLGVDEDTYRVLCQEIDTVYHCGTSMNHLETYAFAKPANVEGVKELLKLTTKTRLKLINYVSTLGIFSPSGADTARIVDEESPIEHEKHLTSTGYVASKWVGERLFMTASERGIPCNIFRLGFIWADTKQGRYDELQRGYRILKSCLLSGYGIKDYRYELAPTPVDYAARAVAFLGSRHPDGRGIFHISSSNQTIDGVFERCNEIADTSLELLPFYQWLCEIKRLHQEGKSLPAVPLIEFAFSMDEASFCAHQRAHSGRIKYDCARTQRELERAAIVAPVFNDDLLRVCLEGMLSRDAELRQWWSSKRNREQVSLAR